MSSKTKNGLHAPKARSFIGMAGLALTVFSFSGSAEAQYFGWGGYYGASHYYGAPPPGAYGYYGPAPDAEPGPPDAPLPIASVRRIAYLAGLHLVTTPRRKGRIYLAEAEDRHGERHRLVVDAYRGTLLQNVRLESKEATPPARKAPRPAPADAMKPPAAGAPRPLAPASTPPAPAPSTAAPDEAKIAPAPAAKPVAPPAPETPPVVAPPPVTAAPTPDAGAAAAIVAPAPPPPSRASEAPAPAPAPPVPAATSTPGGEEAK